MVQLYYGTAGASENALIALSAAPARLRASTTTTPGVWSNGGMRTFQSAGAGAILSLQVRVWDINYGNTYEAAISSTSGSGLLGKSEVFSYTVPEISTNPTNFLMKDFRGFYLLQFPEDAPTSTSPPTTTVCWPSPCSFPQSQSVVAGQNANLTVVVGSCPPELTYIWRFNGNAFLVSNSSLASNSRTYTNILTITNAQLANAGAYSVIVTNIYGALTSPPALLTVIQPVVQPQLVARPVSSNGVQIAWSTNLTSYVLESVPGFGSTWTQVTSGIGVQGNQYILTEPSSAAQKFFRLRKP